MITTRVLFNHLCRNPVQPDSIAFAHDLWYNMVKNMQHEMKITREVLNISQKLFGLVMELRIILSLFFLKILSFLLSTLQYLNRKSYSSHFRRFAFSY